MTQNIIRTYCSNCGNDKVTYHDQTTKITTYVCTSCGSTWTNKISIDSIDKKILDFILFKSISNKTLFVDFIDIIHSQNM